MAILRGPIWVTDTVFLELGWVLGRKLGLDRATVADALTTLLRLETLHTGNPARLAWAIERFRAGADWADVVHLVSIGTAANAFVTFDRHLGQAAGSFTPVPVETLG